MDKCDPSTVDMFDMTTVGGLLDRLYTRLTRQDPPHASDLIFVLAGRMDRKRYGIELYREGYAPRLLLSVGRFEVSKMGTVDFPGTEELIARRDRIPAGERHFFCEMNAGGLGIATPRLPEWNTYGEMVGLREYLRHDMPRRVTFVSTDVHLRRVALTFERVFDGLDVAARYCPVPPSFGAFRREEWWTHPADRRYVLMETIKLAGYGAILRLPEPMIRRIMRLRRVFE